MWQMKLLAFFYFSCIFNGYAKLLNNQIHFFTHINPTRKRNKTGDGRSVGNMKTVAVETWVNYFFRVSNSHSTSLKGGSRLEAAVKTDTTDDGTHLFMPAQVSLCGLSRGKTTRL
jgi:hypothetical protein